MKQVKNTLILFLLLFCFKTKAQVPVINSDSISAIEQKVYSKKTFKINTANTSNYDLKHLKCEWEVDPAVNYIKGCITSTFVTLSNSFNQLEFDLNHLLIVDSVVYHKNKLPFTLQSDDALVITLNSTLSLGTKDSISVYYQGKPVSSGFGSFEQSKHNGVPIIWTLSEPYGAKDWWPCKQVLSDKIDSVDIIVKTPLNNKTASNGLLQSEIQSGNSLITHWKTKYPIAVYLIAFAVTNYSIYSDYVPPSAGSASPVPLQVLNYVFPEDLASAKAQTPDIINIINLFDSLTIGYPFHKEKYGHAQFVWGGGMEHQTMSFMGNFSHVLMAHECAHQWFGNYITCGSWRDIWLNEGFATYFEGLTEERYFPETWMSWKYDKIHDITKEDTGSVYCKDTTQVSRVFSGRLTYNKGAYLLHMLRFMLGNKTFFNAIKNYLNDPALALSYARTSDLKHHLENVSGKNLDTFFKNWFYGEGYPSYHLFWSQKNHVVHFKLEQSTSHSSVPFYEMPVPIQFIGQFKDTIIVFNHLYSGQEFTAKLDFGVAGIKIDPELNLISAKNTVTPVEYDLDLVSIYPNPATNILNIETVNNSNYIKHFVILNDLGQEILKSGYYNNFQKSIQIDLQQLSKGNYTIEFFLQSGKSVKKLIKN